MFLLKKAALLSSPRASSDSSLSLWSSSPPFRCSMVPCLWLPSREIFQECTNVTCPTQRGTWPTIRSCRSKVSAVNHQRENVHISGSGMCCDSMCRWTRHSICVLDINIKHLSREIKLSSCSPRIFMISLCCYKLTVTESTLPPTVYPPLLHWLKAYQHSTLMHHYKNTTFTLQCVCFLSKGPPIILISPEDTTLNMTQDAVLQCQADAYPSNLTYEWWKQGENVYHIEWVQVFICTV